MRLPHGPRGPAGSARRPRGLGRGPPRPLTPAPGPPRGSLPCRARPRALDKRLRDDPGWDSLHAAPRASTRSSQAHRGLGPRRASRRRRPGAQPRPRRTSRSSASSTSAGRTTSRRSSRAPRPLLYDSKDLVTHAVCVGMTGSGKTGLCLGLIEEALLDGIPVLIIDPKGDLPNLCLTFPDLRPEDFAPWINEDDARRKGVTPEEYAAQQAELWRKGLAGVGAGRRADPSPARRGRRRRVHARQHGGAAGVDRQVVRRAGARRPRRRGALPRADRDHRDEPPRAPRDRGRPAPEPGAHPAREAPRDRVAGRPGPRLAGAHPADPEPAHRQGGRPRPRRVLPPEGPVRAGDPAQQPPGRAGLRRLARGRGARRRRAPPHRRGQAARRDLLDRPSLGRRADVLRLAPAERDARLGAEPVRDHQPARHRLHGRDLRLLPAGREPAVEAPAPHAC